MRRPAGGSLGGYEERVRFFLGLLVFVLAAANAANYVLLRQASSSLRDAVEEGVEARGSLAAAELAEAIARAGTAGEAGLTSSRLERIAWSTGCLSVSLLDTTGVTIAAADDTPAGTRDTDFPDGAVLVPASPVAPSYRPSARIVDRQSIMLRFQAIRAPAGEVQLVKTVHDTEVLAATQRSYRALVWTQTVVILVVLVAAFAFGRWISRPFRLIAREASKADLLAGDAGPEGLVAAFRRAVERLQEQEKELGALHAGAGSGSAGIRSFFEGVAQGMTSGLIAVDGAGGFLAANPAAGRILGWERAPAAGAPIESWAGRETPLALLLRSSLAAKDGRSREAIDHPGPGGRGPGLRLGVSVSPIPGGGGPDPPRGILCLIADLSEIRDLEDRVRRREQLATLGSVAAGIAHEVRNALGTILGYARLAERTSQPPARDHSRAIAREVQAIVATVEAFLGFARPSRLSLGPASLRALIDQVIEEARHAGLLGRMEVTVGGEGGTIVADEKMLRQAFGNIVRNAAESSEGQVHLRITMEVSDGAARVTFADDGAGIPADQLERIFLPFYTTRGKGTGLGLAIAQKAVLDHEGAIEARSPEGGGAVFEVRLPVSL